MRADFPHSEEDKAAFLMSLLLFYIKSVCILAFQWVTYTGVPAEYSPHNKQELIN